jgi:hypothetical protein
LVFEGIFALDIQSIAQWNSIGEDRLLFLQVFMVIIFSITKNGVEKFQGKSRSCKNLSKVF